MSKIDLKAELKHLYLPSEKQPAIVDVPAMNFLMIDGQGDPNTAQAYKDSIEALYAISYTLKFMIKKAKSGTDYVVMPLEGLWWADDMSDFTQLQSKDSWKWTSMIMQPEFVTRDLFHKAVDEVKKKKDLAALPKMRFESYHEGLSAQIMYRGPYSAEGPTIVKLHQFIHDSGCQLRGKHHEIYMSDPRRTAAEKLKTVIRQPMAKS